MVAEKLERPPVAFYAFHLSKLTPYNMDDILVFENTYINEGTGYNTATGIFTAPIGGMYEFTVHICAYAGKHSFVALVWESKVIAADENYEGSEHTCNSFGAIVIMKTGEQVWVKSNWEYLGTVQFHEDKNRMNTFRGMMMK